MQTVKTALLILISIAVLGACGLRGPLYLPDEDPATKPNTEGDAGVDVKDSEDKEKGSDPSK
jgi:predicted small lipoprotein YifL